MGRAHVFIHSTRPQSVKYTGLRNLGPRHDDPSRDDPELMQDVLGRYALHFHHCDDGSRGSQIEGVVARDLGAHAFVPHVSHGTSWTSCVAHNTKDFAYWWDPGDVTDDTVFDGCVASSVTPNSPNIYVNGGFLFGGGAPNSNIVRNCVAAGVQGGGFYWYDNHVSNVWQFRDSFAHNNSGSGIAVYQNDSLPHVLSSFTTYNNGEYGIEHGSYGNAFRYEDGVIAANHLGAIGVKAVSVLGDDGVGLVFARLYCDASGKDYAIALPDGSAVKATQPTTIRDCEFHNASKSAISWFRRDGSTGDAPWADISGCRFDGNELWLARGLSPSTRIRYASPTRGRVNVKPLGQPGTATPEWNAATQAA